MTVQGAKALVEKALKSNGYPLEMMAWQTINKALEEVEQYRALGTVEELKEAREKQIAKKPIWIKRSVTKFQVCPCCSNAEHYQMIFKSQKYCSECGQALKWGEEE